VFVSLFFQFLNAPFFADRNVFNRCSTAPVFIAAQEGTYSISTPDEDEAI